MQLFIAPPSPGMLKQYAHCLSTRGYTVPPPPKEVIMVSTAEGFLVAGTAIYEAGPMLVAEFLVTSPWAPLRVRHRAVELVIEAFVRTASQRGLATLAMPTSIGVARLLERAGLKQQRAAVYAAPPSGSLVGEAQIPNARPRQSQERARGSLTVHNKETQASLEEPSMPRKRAQKKKA